MQVKHNRKTGIIGDALAPHFNTAPANQMRLLSQELKAGVLTGNDLGFFPFKKMGQYLIINTRFLRAEKRNRLLSLINGACFFPAIKIFERKYDIVYLAGGIDSGFLRVLNRGKCVLIVNSFPFGKDDERAKKFSRDFAPELPGIIAQSQRVKERLISAGVEQEKIHVVYPWVDTARFKYSQPPDSEEFGILSASAPDMESSLEDIFAIKGMDMLLEAFAEFSRNHKAILHLLWRGKYNERLRKKLAELNIEKSVRVIDTVTDTPPLYAQTHITVIPYLTRRAGPEIPLSAVESLACGRPVVTTNVPEIAEIVQAHKCGTIAKPIKDSFVSALTECKQNYRLYQANCRKTASELFSLNVESLRGLYE